MWSVLGDKDTHGWGAGSAGKMAVLQARRLEFGYPGPVQNLGAIVHIGNFRPGEAEASEFPEPAGQSI